MQETTAAKLNNIFPLPFEREYIKIPVALKYLPSSAQLVGGLLNSFSGKLDADGVYSTLNKSRADMREKLLLSFPSLSRAVKTLTEKGYASQLSRNEYIFNRDKLYTEDFYRLELDTLKEIMNDADRIQGVTVRVAAWFNTTCNNSKPFKNNPERETLRKEHKISASYSEIAAFVGCSERQAKRAVKKLLKMNIIHRPQSDKGTSSKHKSIYSLDRAYWRRIKKPKAAASEEHTAEPAEPTEPEQTERQLEAETLRELYINKAIDEANRNQRIANGNKRYREAHTKIAGLQVEAAFAGLNSPEKAAQLEKELKRWQLEECAALKALVLTRELLDEEYILKLYMERGAPPGNGDNVGVGEQNN